VRTASVGQVRQAIYTRSVGRWKNYERSLGPLFTKLSSHRSHDTPQHDLLNDNPTDQVYNVVSGDGLTRI
jgi:hypothetical protein